MTNPTSLAFRAAVREDIPAIVTLVESAYRGDASRVGWTTEADLLDGQRIDPEGVIADIERDASQVLLAEQDGVLLACCHIERKGDFGYFGMFAVQPGRQGGGLGRAVLAEAERRLQTDMGCREVRMTVIDVRDDLIAWYERRGYRRTGEYAPFPYGDERFGIPKREDLRFEWLRKPLTTEHAA
ncbi:GNAT family N-acetyltransferase [Oleiagrimonas soli]|nr:GNAT family N-acetyltransferase [Oleiagrimonas soli]